MIYAIVTEYTDGHTATQYVDQKAVPASKTNPWFTPCVVQKTNTLYIEYAQAIHPERKRKLFDAYIERQYSL